MKGRIREFALGLGVDDVGFASVSDYRSPQSPPVESLMSDCRSIVVLAYRELSSCASTNPLIAMNGRLDAMSFTRSAGYRIARMIERDFGSQAVSIPVSYPMDLGKAWTGEFSLRHAALAAGLGAFGRHNLIVHPRFGSRVIFTAILTGLDLPSDPAVSESPCNQCGICVQDCPAGALSREGITDQPKCYKNSQPHGLGASSRFWIQFAKATGEEQKAMMRSPEYANLYQAAMIGFQYDCFKCMSSCPIGMEAQPG